MDAYILEEIDINQQTRMYCMHATAKQINKINKQK